MKVIERDKHEGDSFFLTDDSSVDLVVGKLLRANDEHYGWYTIKRTIGSEKLVDYVDPNTFETYNRLCVEFVCRRMRLTDTGWQVLTVMIPVDECKAEQSNAFERAMEMVEG